MLSRAQGRPRPPSAAQDAPTRARGGLQALPDGAASTATPCRAPSGPPLYAGSGDMTRVRGSCRVFGGHAGCSGHRTGSLPPSNGGRPRSEGRTPVRARKAPSRGPRRARSQRGESRAGVSRATLAGAAPRAARVGSAGPGGPRRADFITPIPAPSRRKPGAWPTRYVRGPHCPISESRRGFSSPLQRKPCVRPPQNVRG